MNLPNTSSSSAAPTPERIIPEPAAAEPPPTAPQTDDLGELWQQILAGLELPSTRMLLSQQARLVRIDNHRAVVQVAGNWMGMVQSRVALLEQAIARAMGGSRQLVLENHGAAAPMAAMPASPAPAPAPAPSTPTPATAPSSPSPTSTPTPTPGPDRGAQLPPRPQPDPPAAAPPPLSEPLLMDDKVKRFADFFNGQVLDVDLDS